MILIVGTRRGYYAYLHQRRLRAGETIHIGSITRLRGRSAEEVVVLPDAADLPDYTEIRSYLQAHLMLPNTAPEPRSQMFRLTITDGRGRTVVERTIREDQLAELPA